MAIYNNLMYIGTKNEVTGTQIWTYDGTDWLMFYNENDAGFPYSKLVVYKKKLYFASGFGNPPDSRNRVLVYNGTTWTNTSFNDGNANEKIDDLATYDGKLFLSTYSEGNGCQVWSYDESGWELVSDAGFGDTDNHVGLSMTVHDNRLLVCTGNLVSGGQLWAYDGEEWTQINISGFGNADNALVLANVFEGTLYAGTFNNVTGGELWLLDGQDWVRINTGADFNDAVSALATGSIGNQLGLFVLSDYGIGIYAHVPPQADAGPDQTVVEGATVLLDGSNSSTTIGDTHLWSQQSGTTVTLTDTSSLTPSFVAPEVGAGGDALVFHLTISDNGGHQASDQVTINITNQCTLTTSSQGNGTVSLNPSGGTYAEGTSVTLTATPETGYQFDRWDGDVTGPTNPLTITLNSDMRAIAIFVEQSGGSSGGGGGSGCFLNTIK